MFDVKQTNFELDSMRNRTARDGGLRLPSDMEWFLHEYFQAKFQCYLTLLCIPVLRNQNFFRQKFRLR